jgi:hypothetical protein
MALKTVFMNTKEAHSALGAVLATDETFYAMNRTPSEDAYCAWEAWESAKAVASKAIALAETTDAFKAWQHEEAKNPSKGRRLHTLECPSYEMLQKRWELHVY